MASSSANVNPAVCDFIGHDPSTTKEERMTDPTLGHLQGLTFSSCCPPDVQSTTRIVAVCGIADNVNEDSIEEPIVHEQSGKFITALKQSVSMVKDLFSASRRQKRKEAEEAQGASIPRKGEASPWQDGWFMSDFYLFWHIFHGFGANQLWLTSESPASLAQKYGQYTHGEPSDRRVVLNETMLPQIQKAENIRVSSRDGLLEDFLHRFQIECQIAADKSQSMLLLVFGHGDCFTRGITIGGTASDVGKRPKLHIRKIKSIVDTVNIDAALLTSPCHSAGWLHTNWSGRAAAEPINENLSWPPKLGGLPGSFWATAVTKAFVQAEDERIRQVHPNSGQEIDPNEILYSSTFDHLSRVIYEALSDDDRRSTYHQVRFANQDGEWGCGSRQRSGITLLQFEERWSNLPLVRPSAKGLPLSRYYGCKPGISEVQARAVVKELCRTYFQSNPGVSNRSGNHIPHGLAKEMLRGHLTNGEVAQIQRITQYRLDLMHLANAYRDSLDLKFPDCQEIDPYLWKPQLAVNDIGRSLHPEPEKDRFYSRCLYAIQGSTTIFPDHPRVDSYLKPHNYLAAAIVDNKETWTEIEQTLDLLERMTAAYVDTLTARIRNNPAVRNAARDAFQLVRKRLRSLSP